MSNLKTLLAYKHFLKDLLDRVRKKRQAAELNYSSERFKQEVLNQSVIFENEGYILTKLISFEREIEGLYIKVAAWSEYMRLLINSVKDKSHKGS